MVMNDSEKLLTKAQILEGKEYTEKVYIEKLKGSLEIRPLREAEWARAQSINVRGVEMITKMEPPSKSTGKAKAKSSEMKIDMEVSSEANSEAERYIVSCGVTNINITPEDVKRMRPAGVVAEIAEKIQKLTGVSLKGGKELKSELAKKFREDE